MNTQENARFWVWVNGAWSKLTLAPGQRLERHSFETTDEGWSSYAESWELSSDGHELRRETTSDGCDCDGRLTTGCDAMAIADPSHYLPCGPYEPAGMYRPNWIDAGGWQRDQFAEAAGY